MRQWNDDALTLKRRRRWTHLLQKLTQIFDLLWASSWPNDLHCTLLNTHRRPKVAVFNKIHYYCCCCYYYKYYYYDYYYYYWPDSVETTVRSAVVGWCWRDTSLVTDSLTVDSVTVLTMLVFAGWSKHHNTWWLLYCMLYAVLSTICWSDRWRERLYWAASRRQETEQRGDALCRHDWS